ncbi:MAG: 4Fe-4S dicluster domain-containing protein [Desulfohalobiaceae bacterium]
MSQTKFLPEDKLTAWLQELSSAYNVLVPVQEKGSLLFKPFAGQEEINLSQQPTLPPKDIVFPCSETLFGFQNQKDPQHPEKVQVQLQENEPQGQNIVFGARPCGARGFRIFDQVFASDSLSDPYYQKRRQNTFFITLACQSPENTCFCHWVGSSPQDTQGSDLLLTPVQGGFLAQAVTSQGEKLLNSELLAPAEKAQIQAAEEARENALQQLDSPPDLQEVPQDLLQVFQDMEFWEQMAAKCISCGACTYLCPTCYCFNITDETHGLQGRRIRSWDYCLSYLFTLEASGHNPRPSKAHRLKNRVGHKFSYYPQLHQQEFACCGCGRCIKHCPACVDIRSIILKLKERAHALEE